LLEEVQNGAIKYISRFNFNNFMRLVFGPNKFKMLIKNKQSIEYQVSADGNLRTRSENAAKTKELSSFSFMVPKKGGRCSKKNYIELTTKTHTHTLSHTKAIEKINFLI